MSDGNATVKEAKPEKPNLLEPSEISEIRDEMMRDGKWMNGELKRSEVSPSPHPARPKKPVGPV